MVQIYCDGACEPVNPGGVGTWGFIAYQEGEVLYKSYGLVGKGEGQTNNRAEYHAVLHALRWAYQKGLAQVDVYTDSRLVVQQIKGEWRVRSESLQPLWIKCQKAKDHVNYSVNWIPREQNEEADRLSKVAYRQRAQLSICCKDQTSDGGIS